MKYDEIEQKVQSYRWLKSIAKDYREMIDRIHAEKDYFRVEKIAYTARGNMQYLDLNCHRTIPSHYIAEGLQEALAGIEDEIKQLEAEMKSIDIELWRKQPSRGAQIENYVSMHFWMQGISRQAAEEIEKIK